MTTLLSLVLLHKSFLYYANLRFIMEHLLLGHTWRTIGTPFPMGDHLYGEVSSDSKQRWVRKTSADGFLTIFFRYFNVRLMSIWRKIRSEVCKLMFSWPSCVAWTMDRVKLGASSRRKVHLHCRWKCDEHRVISVMRLTSHFFVMINTLKMWWYFLSHFHAIIDAIRVWWNFSSHIIVMKNARILIFIAL